MKKFLVLFLPAILLSCTTIGSENANNDMVSVWTVDRSGAPPFKRSLVEVPAADIARLELEAEDIETETMRVVDFRGKPPFRRIVKEVPVIDISSLEIEESNSQNTRSRHFYKRHR